jgi:hypothetical protein
MKDTKEFWIPIVGYEGLYEVSNLGNTRSLDRILSHPSKGRITKRGGIKKQTPTKRGYKSVTLSKLGKSKTLLVHRLVAIAFIPNTNKKPCINHKDGVKTNNNVENLEWVTHSENIKHSWDIGIRVYSDEQKLMVGDGSPARKVKEVDRKIIYECLVRKIHTKQELAEKYNVHKTTINNIFNQQFLLTKHSK